MKKIAVLLPDLRPGGVERMRLNMCEEWIAAGYQVDIVVMKERGELLSVLPMDVELVSLGVSRYRSAVYPLIRYLNNCKPDVLLAAMWPLTIVGVVASWIAMHTVRVVVSDHSILSAAFRVRGRLHRLFLAGSLRMVYPIADARIVVSKGVAEDLESLSGLRRQAFQVIYNPAFTTMEDGSATDESLPWLADSTHSVLAVGTLKEVKNFELLIRAFALVRERISAELYILGEGVLRAPLESLIKQLNVTECVFLEGYRADTAPWYRRADLFVLSSNYEGFGNVIVEALGHGLPVVSTDCPAGPREILCDGKYGVLVPVGDVASMAQAIIFALNNVHDPDLLRSRARDFSVDKIAKQYLDVMFPAIICEESA